MDMNSLLVVIDKFYVPCVSAFPSKANPVLIVHADTVLPFPIATKSFQMIARGISEIFRRLRKVHRLNLADSGFSNAPKLPTSSCQIELPSVVVPKRPDH
jgi:hypothetical protein